MMKKMLLFAIIFTLSVPLAHAQYGAWTGNANFFIGGKFLPSIDWSPTENQLCFGGRFDFRPSSWPINFAFDVYYSSDDDRIFFSGPAPLHSKATTTELCFGVRKVMDTVPFFHPYFGGGFAYINAEAELSGQGSRVSDSDWSPGFWFSGGANWILVDHINLGLDVGYSYARVDLFNVDVQGGGFRVGAMAGFHW